MAWLWYAIRIIDYGLPPKVFRIKFFPGRRKGFTSIQQATWRSLISLAAVIPRRLQITLFRNFQHKAIKSNNAGSLKVWNTFINYFDFNAILLLHMSKANCYALIDSDFWSNLCWNFLEVCKKKGSVNDWPPPWFSAFRQTKIDPQDKDNYKDNDNNKYILEHHQRVILKICDLNESWSSENLFSFNSDKPCKFYQCWFDDDFVCNLPLEAKQSTCIAIKTIGQLTRDSIRVLNSMQKGIQAGKVYKYRSVWHKGS